MGGMRGIVCKYSRVPDTSRGGGGVAPPTTQESHTSGHVSVPVIDAGSHSGCYVHITSQFTSGRY